MTTQIAVKLDDAIVARLDELVRMGRFASRSAAVRHGLAAVIDDERRSQIDEAFRSGFARHPETATELADAVRLAVEAIEDEPWDPWW